jgi:hypothetical protein
MFFTIAMIIDRINAAWPTLQEISPSVLVWGVVLAAQIYLFEETRRRTALRLQATLRAWYLRGPGAYGASLIEAEPLGITYEYLGRKKRAVIAFLWSRIEFKLV